MFCVLFPTAATASHAVIAMGKINVLRVTDSLLNNPLFQDSQHERASHALTFIIT